MPNRLVKRNFPRPLFSHKIAMHVNMLAEFGVLAGRGDANVGMGPDALDLRLF